MNNRQQFIKQFFSEIANLNYTYLNFIEGNLEEVSNQSDLAILMDSDNIPLIDAFTKNNDLVEHTVMIAMSNMHQFAVTFKDGSTLNLDCIFKLTRRGIVYLSNDYLHQNTVVRQGVKCCNHKSFFELMMLYHQLNEDGMPKDFCNYFRSINSFPNILSSFNEKYHAGFTIENICDHDSDFKSKLKSYLNIMRDNAFGENMRNTFSYAKDKCTKVLTGRGIVVPFGGMEVAASLRAQS